MSRMHCGVHICSLRLTALIMKLCTFVVTYCIIPLLSGFAGSNALENLELFSIVDAAADAWVHVYDANYHEKNEELKVVIKTQQFVYIHPFYCNSSL